MWGPKQEKVRKPIVLHLYYWISNLFKRQSNVYVCECVYVNYVNY